LKNTIAWIPEIKAW